MAGRSGNGWQSGWQSSSFCSRLPRTTAPRDSAIWPWPLPPSELTPADAGRPPHPLATSARRPFRQRRARQPTAGQPSTAAAPTPRPEHNASRRWRSRTAAPRAPPPTGHPTPPPSAHITTRTARHRSGGPRRRPSTSTAPPHAADARSRSSSVGSQSAAGSTVPPDCRAGPASAPTEPPPDPPNDSAGSEVSSAKPRAWTRARLPPANRIHRGIEPRGIAVPHLVLVPTVTVPSRSAAWTLPDSMSRAARAPATNSSSRPATTTHRRACPPTPVRRLLSRPCADVEIPDRWRPHDAGAHQPEAHLCVDWRDSRERHHHQPPPNPSAGDRKPADGPIDLLKLMTVRPVNATTPTCYSST